MLRSLFLAFLLPLVFCSAASSLESPPAQGSELTFEKTLFVQEVAGMKVFAESHQVAKGDTLWQLLTQEYGISPKTAPRFIDAFQTVNPGLDPDRLFPGAVIRVPFKLEERVAAPAESAGVAEIHVVQPGENLWRILANRYGVPLKEMGATLRSVATANPNLRDLDRLVVGQRLVIPEDVASRAAELRRGVNNRPLPPSYNTILDLLSEMGCKVAETGETFLPLARGRTVRLDAKDFPLITGFDRAAIILDPRSRLAPALVQNIRQTWGYRVVRGIDPDPEVQLSRLLPHLGFEEVNEGLRTVVASSGTTIKALVRWAVLPRPEDLWEGRIHLLFPSGSQLHPALVGEVHRSGFRVHRLGIAPEVEPKAESTPAARLAMTDPGRGAGELLRLLGVSHRVRPEVECQLAGGVNYQLRPLLTFHHFGLPYAVPPSQPANAESLLSRAGYFTIPWAATSPMNLLADLLALLAVPHSRTTLDIPEDGGLRVSAPGILLESPELIGFLYPRIGDVAKPVHRAFLTEAQLSDAVTGVFLAQGVGPWVVDSR